jgi:hypothetical protein
VAKLEVRMETVERDIGVLEGAQTAMQAKMVSDEVCTARTQNIIERIDNLAKRFSEAEQRPGWFERLQRKASGISAILALLVLLGAFLYHLSRVIVRMERVLTESTEQLSRDAEEMKKAASRGPVKIFVPMPASEPEPKTKVRRRKTRPKEE